MSDFPIPEIVAELRHVRAQWRGQYSTPSAYR